MTSHSFNRNYGSETDLPGFKVPATAEEANNARGLITWAVTNIPFPQFLPVPQDAYQWRHGFGTPNNGTPMVGSFWMVNPAAMTAPQIIPSGSRALYFEGGVFTFPSGTYIYNAALKNPGTLVQVANTAEDTTDAGKLKYIATYGTRVVGKVRRYNPTTAALTVEID
jgi:hypothetical protein